jgi:hypothetical protein
MSVDSSEALAKLFLQESLQGLIYGLWGSNYSESHETLKQSVFLPDIGSAKFMLRTIFLAYAFNPFSIDLYVQLILDLSIDSEFFCMDATPKIFVEEMLDQTRFFPHFNKFFHPIYCAA